MCLCVHECVCCVCVRMYCHILYVEVREQLAGVSPDLHLVYSMEITQIIRLRDNWLYCLRHWLTLVVLS